MSDFARFWKSFLDIFKILFKLLYSTRVGKWNFYTEASKKQSSLIFCKWQAKLQLLLNSPLLQAFYARSKLSRNLGIISEWKFFCSDFNIPFGRMEADKVIESTINRGTKTPGGTTGIFHLLKNQNTWRCRDYLWEKFLRSSSYLYFFEI